MLTPKNKIGGNMLGKKAAVGAISMVLTASLLTGCKGEISNTPSAIGKVTASKTTSQVKDVRNRAAGSKSKHTSRTLKKRVKRAKRVSRQKPRGSIVFSGEITPKGTNQRIGHAMAADKGWTGVQWNCLQKLWYRESGWSTRASNSSGTAWGIPQALPGSKMASAGSDWRTNPATQIRWGLGYIDNRYGSPCKAWAHSERYNWY